MLPISLTICIPVDWIDFALVNCVSPGCISTDMFDVHPK